MNAMTQIGEVRYSAAYPTGAERAVDMAVLSSSGKYTSFSYGDNVIRFMTSPALVRYKKVLKWDNGYLEVIANYNGREEEEYIDLVPILDNLLIDADSFLSPIKKVEVSYADSKMTEAGSAKFFVKADGETQVAEKGQLNEREISGIQAFIRKHYQEMYLKWSEMSDSGFYVGE